MRVRYCWPLNRVHLASEQAKVDIRAGEFGSRASFTLTVLREATGGSKRLPCWPAGRFSAGDSVRPSSGSSPNSWFQLLTRQDIAFNPQGRSLTPLLSVGCC